MKRHGYGSRSETRLFISEALGETLLKISNAQAQKGIVTDEQAGQVTRTTVRSAVWWRAEACSRWAGSIFIW